MSDLRATYHTTGTLLVPPRQVSTEQKVLDLDVVMDFARDNLNKYCVRPWMTICIEFD